MLVLLSLVACGGAEQSRLPPEPPHVVVSPPPSSSPATETTQAQLSPPIDEKAVAAATGVEPENAGGVVKASFPRKDVEVAVDGWKMPPFMGLTSWAAFSPGKLGVAEAMVMGDVVLFEDEVNPVMSVLLENGVEVTALHNHFFFDQPRVYFMHIGGEGTVASLGKGVKLAMEKSAEIRKKTPKPSTSSGAPQLPAKSTLDAAKMEAAFGGMKGTAKDGMWKLVAGRETKASCGCTVGKAMGVNTWAAFAGSDEVAVVDGDFSVAENELQPVLKELRAGGVNIVAIHHHMSGETPRLLFLHYWGRGKAQDLAAVVKRALDKTAYVR
jgi:hypothetical protein